MMRFVILRWVQSLVCWCYYFDTMPICKYIYVVFGPRISIRDSVTHNNGGIRIVSRHWIGFYPYYANLDNEKAITEGKHSRVAFAAHAITYKIGHIPIGGINSFQSLSRSISMSRQPAAMTVIGYLSTQVSAKLDRTTSLVPPQHAHLKWVHWTRVWFGIFLPWIALIHAS